MIACGHGTGVGVGVGVGVVGTPPVACHMKCLCVVSVGCTVQVLPCGSVVWVEFGISVPSPRYCHVPRAKLNRACPLSRGPPQPLVCAPHWEPNTRTRTVFPEEEMLVIELQSPRM